jgi:membrane protein DedA with SNARE-associated domain
MNVSDHRTVPQLFTDVINQLTSLFRTEVRLARAEVSENLSHVGSGAGLLVAGAVLIMPGLVILLQAGVAALIDQGFQPHWAALIVGGTVILLGIVLAWLGARRLRPSSLVPQKTLEQLQRDAAVARRQVG